MADAALWSRGGRQQAPTARAVLGDRHARPDALQLPQVDIHNRQARSQRILQAPHDLAPRVDNQAVAIAVAFLVVPACLRGRDHVALRLYGARAQQNFPVRLACGGVVGREDWGRWEVAAS